MTSKPTDAITPTIPAQPSNDILRDADSHPHLELQEYPKRV